MRNENNAKKKEESRVTNQGERESATRHIRQEEYDPTFNTQRARKKNVTMNIISNNSLGAAARQ